MYNTRKKIGSQIQKFFFRKKIDKKTFKILEESLLLCDVGLNTASKVISNLKKKVIKKNIIDKSIVLNILQDELLYILKKSYKPLIIKNKYPFLILVVGVNGVGKTTTVGKLAWKYKQQGRSVMIAAGDTFRAAAIEQLNIISKKILVPVVSQHYKADSAAVIFDAIQSAKRKNVEILIADTSGRLHNNKNFISELRKIIKVTKKIDVSFPDETILVIDSSSGHNIINQVRIFKNETNVTGIIVTKLDGSAKGGMIFNISDEFNIPVRYISTGENKEDLHKFECESFVKSIFK
ncbi:signal recognition particle-docking protein FtsY [Buchnera aphidicola (Chaitoregma tattakana)]|uniref:signal recognition particle-docking protein FtsY n=1 Tax=Buchnera aphidicola TaxID=9 RepID=UPI0031B821FC